MSPLEVEKETGKYWGYNVTSVNTFTEMIELIPKGNRILLD